MALEYATYVNQLDASNPSNTDYISQADDHIRLIKSVILSSFPHVSAPVTATHTQLNGITDNVSVDIYDTVTIYDTTLGINALKNAGSIESGSFTGTLEWTNPLDGATSQDVTIYWRRVGYLVTLSAAGNLILTGDGNPAYFHITGLPSSIIPSSAVVSFFFGVMQSGVPANGFASIPASGSTISFAWCEPDNNIPTTFYNGGDTGLCSGWNMTYSLT